MIPVYGYYRPAEQLIGVFLTDPAFEILGNNHHFPNYRDGDVIPYFQSGFMPEVFRELNSYTVFFASGRDN